MVENAKHTLNTKLSFFILIGMLLYLSKYSRSYFHENEHVLFILGFLPNFGLAFAMPFIWVSNRLRHHKIGNTIWMACLVTFLLMVLNEVRDIFQKDRVFDMLDIYASLAAVILAYFIYTWVIKQAVKKLQ